MHHWIARAASRAKLTGADELHLAANTPVEVAWEAAIEACDATSSELAEAVAAFFRLPTADLAHNEPTAVKLVPASLATRFCVFPLRDRDRNLELAVSDPTNPEMEQQIGFASGRIPLLRVAPPGDIRKAIVAGYPTDQAAASLLAHVTSGVEDAVDLSKAEAIKDATEAEIESEPVVRLTKMVFQRAIEEGASDIHIQPSPSGGVVRYRVDGVLRTGLQMPLVVMARVVSRIKILGNMDITDHLRAQDGRAQIKVHDQSYDLRISTVPTRRAEKAVIRILAPQGSGTLSDTGIPPGEVERIRAAVGHRDGIVVVTGPTGSGKTSTLYSAIREIATEGVNIMTVEDPVEYELPGLTQVQVETAQGMTFASALRAILRQDPDVILVGEIRDRETAEIAAQASLTGHLVLTTLHTNDAVGAIRRFLDLGLDMATLTETLRAALAQRLIRTLCPHCSAPVTDPPTPEEDALSKRYGTRPTRRAVGCDECAQTGYAGRAPIIEFMTVSEELMRLAADGASPSRLRRQAVNDGMTPLLGAALARVAAGETTLQEVERVVAQPEDASAPETSATPESVPISDEEAVDLTEDAAHILLVDDDGTNRRIARAVLQKAGYRVSESPDGMDGLGRLARGERFDLMVLDLDMPMLGGRQVLKSVRETVATAGLTVVVLTGTLEPNAEVELLQAGADDYISKPLEPQRFLGRIQAALRRASG